MHKGLCWVGIRRLMTGAAALFIAAVTGCQTTECGLLGCGKGCKTCTAPPVPRSGPVTASAAIRTPTGTASLNSAGGAATATVDATLPGTNAPVSANASWGSVPAVKPPTGELTSAPSALSEPTPPPNSGGPLVPTGGTMERAPMRPAPVMTEANYSAPVPPPPPPMMSRAEPTKIPTTPALDLAAPVAPTVPAAPAAPAILPPTVAGGDAVPPPSVGGFKIPD